MTKRTEFRITRRDILKTTVAGVVAVAAPAVISGRAQAAGKYMDLDALRGAAIWEEAKDRLGMLTMVPASVCSRVLRRPISFTVPSKLLTRMRSLRPKGRSVKMVKPPKTLETVS